MTVEGGIIMFVEYIKVKGKRYKLREWVTISIMLLSTAGFGLGVYFFTVAVLLMFDK